MSAHGIDVPRGIKVTPAQIDNFNLYIIPQLKPTH